MKEKVCGDKLYIEQSHMAEQGNATETVILECERKTWHKTHKCIYNDGINNFIITWKQMVKKK